MEQGKGQNNYWEDKKEDGISSSKSNHDVAEDVPNIILSASKKPAGKKAVQTIKSVPIDKISFHPPKNVHRWKFIYHRRLALEKENWVRRPCKLRL